MKKKLALILVAAMMFSVMSGCAIQKNIYKDNPELAEEELNPSASTQVHDFDAAYAKYDKNMVVASVNGIDVTWQEYFYWCVNALMTVETSAGTITNFDEDFSGMSYGDYIRTVAENNCRQYRSFDFNAAQEGIVLSTESAAAIDAQLQTDITSYSPDGTEEGFNNYLETLYTSREIYDYFNRVAMLYSDGFTYYCGAEGEKITDEEALAYGEDAGLMVAKHILLKTIDDNNEPISDEAKAAQLELAKELVARINGGEAFDTLMAEYNEDPGAAYYPDGYCFAEGQMVPEFEAAVKELKPGEMTEQPVESSYGYHIIMREELTPDAAVMTQSGSVTLRQLTASDKYNSIVNNWFNASELTYVDGFDVNFNQLFGVK